MDRKKVPQDKGVFGQWHGICYATDESGNYVRERSSGWEPVNVANEQAWDIVAQRLSFVREKIEEGELSPLAWFMEKNLMDVKTLAGYAGIAGWRVKRHLNAKVFRRLPASVLERYAAVFSLSVDQLVSGEDNG